MGKFNIILGTVPTFEERVSRNVVAGLRAILKCVGVFVPRVVFRYVKSRTYVDVVDKQQVYEDTASLDPLPLRQCSCNPGPCLCDVWRPDSSDQQ